MSFVLHRHCHQDFPTAVRGDGPYLIDAEGKRYLDASGGAAVSSLGHSHRAVIEAVKAQLDQLAYAHTGFFTSEPAEALAAFLISRAPEGFARVYFACGGSEANESALKLARQHAVEIGEPDRRLFISRRQSYHGNTLGALAISGDPARRRIYDPILPEATLIGPCNPYRLKEPGESDEAYGFRAANELETAIQALGPARVAAFVAEPVVGMTAGAVPAVPGYFARIREICDRHGVLLIFDEVMCGMGRTGSLFACAYDGVVPDILTCAKGLGAGYQPIAAVLVGRRVYDAVAAGSGAFVNGYTYVGHAAACAAALAVQRAIEDEDLLANVTRQGEALRTALLARFGDHPHVGDVRGRGLFRALELVADRDRKTTFDPGCKLHARIKAEAMARGLMCFPNGGTADGLRGDHVLLAPPFIIAQAHVEEIVDKLAGALEAALASLGTGLREAV